MNTFKWISGSIKYFRISKSIAGSQDVQARLLGTAVALSSSLKPKRPLRPFSAYWISALNDVKKQHPGLKQRDVIKVLGQKWNQLSKTEKEPYYKNYETGMSNYVKEIAKCNKISLTPEQVQQVLFKRSPGHNTTKKVLKLAVTKRPTNSYLQYMSVNLPKKFKQDERRMVFEQLAQKWKALSEQEKEPYVRRYQAEKEAYKKLLTKLEQETLQREQQDVDRPDVPVAAASKRKSK